MQQGAAIDGADTAGAACSSELLPWALPHFSCHQPCTEKAADAAGAYGRELLLRRTAQAATSLLMLPWARTRQARATKVSAASNTGMTLALASLPQAHACQRLLQRPLSS